jgi:hypothetical protein
MIAPAPRLTDDGLLFDDDKTGLLYIHLNRPARASSPALKSGRSTFRGHPWEVVANRLKWHEF